MDASHCPGCGEGLSGRDSYCDNWPLCEDHDDGDELRFDREED